MYSLSQLGLRTTASGMPLEWIDYKDAVRLHYQGSVVYSLGEIMYTIHGGINAATGKRSFIKINSIIATGNGDYKYANYQQKDYSPPLNNEALFARDGGMCMYCGITPRRIQLSRDHITPISRGGTDSWNNVVTACKRCNNHKAGRTPDEAGMALLAVPFVPNYAEYVFLKGRRVLADQMEFLAAHFPRTSPLRQRIQKALN